MGACEAVHTFEAPNLKAAIKVASEIINESRYTDGHEYSGCIGMASGVVPAVQKSPVTENKAYELVFGNDANEWRGLAEKWGPAILVRIRNKGSRKAKWMLAAIVAE